MPPRHLHQRPHHVGPPPRARPHHRTRTHHLRRTAQQGRYPMRQHPVHDTVAALTRRQRRTISVTPTVHYRATAPSLLAQLRASLAASPTAPGAPPIPTTPPPPATPALARRPAT